MKPLRILVVDDDADNADSLAELFEIEGHDVTVAYNGETAVTAYSSEDFDIAFMDVMMPGMNGVESFLAIRRLKPDAVVYMMTGYSVEDLLTQATENGAVGVLYKPFEPGDILDALTKVLPEGIVLVSQSDDELGRKIQGSIEQTGRRCELLTTRECLRAGVSADGDVEVLIIDQSVKLIEGLDCYAHLRSSGRPTPAIFLSAVGDIGEDDGDHVTHVNATGVLTKPFNPEILLKNVNRLL